MAASGQLDGDELIEFVPFASLKGVLKLKPHALSAAAYPQLTAITKHLRAWKCEAIVIERTYVDSDFLADYLAFYGRNFRNHSNHTRRLTFFRCTPSDLRDRIRRLLASVAAAPADQRELTYKHLCRELSHEVFLGFMAVRPLDATPVGRTVLRPPVNASDGDSFESAVTSHAHLLGIEFTVKGLPFQQQDQGVSACATVSLWSSLQKLRERRLIQNVPPAAITTVATRSHLTYGRRMPSPGLSVEQMCEAVDAIGASPVLVNFDSHGPNAFKLEMLHCSVKSGFAPVLILKEQKTSYGHAVVVAGMRTGKRNARDKASGFRSAAENLDSLYLNDDRTGPYIRVSVKNGTIKLPRGSRDDASRVWDLDQLLLPVPTSIHLSPQWLQRFAVRLVTTAAEHTSMRQGRLPLIFYSCWFDEGTRYTLQFVAGEHTVDTQSIASLTNTLSILKYIGVVRFEFANKALVDVLLDTTTAGPHVHVLGLVSVGEVDPAALDALQKAASNPPYIALRPI